MYRLLSDSDPWFILYVLGQSIYRIPNGVDSVLLRHSDGKMATYYTFISIEARGRRETTVEGEGCRLTTVVIMVTKLLYRNSHTVPTEM